MDSTPLHRSLELAKDYNVSRILIENGADLCNRNVDGETPLHTHFGSVVEQVLLAHAYLLDYSVRDGRGKTLLHHLAWSSRTSRETFERVSACSGHVNGIVDGEQRSVLHHAAQRGNIAVVEYILARLDLNVNVKDKIGRTPLHYAIESSRAPTTINLLISNGADIGAQDDKGWSALHLATHRDKEAAARALKHAGLSSELLTEDCRGQTPVQAAEKDEAQNVLPIFNHTIPSRQKGLRASELNPCDDKAAPKRERTDLKGLLEDIEEKKNLHLPMSRRWNHELPSQQVVLAGVKPLGSALRMFSCAVLLCGIWLICAWQMRTRKGGW